MTAVTTEPCYIRSVHQARCDLCDWTGHQTGDELEASEQAAWHRSDPAHQARMLETPPGPLVWREPA
jgi:hypothetical protein